MSNSALKTIMRQLDSLALSPNRPDAQEPLITFALSSHITTELVLNQVSKTHLSVTLLTSIDAEHNEELDIFALALAARISPLKLTTLEHQLCLQLTFHCSPKTLKISLNEAIVLMRHMSGAIFTGAVSLMENKEDLMDVLATTVEHLSQPRLANV
ncbi:hypothetical protein [Endozoicomonas arenosclerae]|uniref:hypothetical protein n=1 Tax=Endozoicomonas arenosclerae TaxID=1633495 RepID=UPI0007812033|nr:hypothetical protein [Endozoicomonas arenosclerae]